MGGGIGRFGERTAAAGNGGGGIATIRSGAGLVSGGLIFDDASPIFISGNFISPK